MKLKQAPREAFLFGYAAVLMAAGPNSYFILGDERNQEYYYPEMDQPVGQPKGKMVEAAPHVFRRDFEKCSAFLKMSPENTLSCLNPGLYYPSGGPWLKLKISRTHKAILKVGPQNLGYKN